MKKKILIPIILILLIGIAIGGYEVLIKEKYTDEGILSHSLNYNDAVKTEEIIEITKDGSNMSTTTIIRNYINFEDIFKLSKGDEKTNNFKVENEFIKVERDTIKQNILLKNNANKNKEIDYSLIIHIKTDKIRYMGEEYTLKEKPIELITPIDPYNGKKRNPNIFFGTDNKRINFKDVVELGGYALAYNQSIELRIDKINLNSYQTLIIDPIYSNKTDGFNVASIGVGNTRGLTTNNSDFWIADWYDLFVYHTDRFGNNITDGFGLAILGLVNPICITTINSDFWIVCIDINYVYHTNRFGNNLTGFNTTQFSQGTSPLGVTTNGSDFWISVASDFVYHANKDGNNMGDGFSASLIGSGDPVALIRNGSDFWILDPSDTFVYHTDRYGNNISDGFNTLELIGSDSAYGLATNITTGRLTDFWILDNTDSFVYHIRIEETTPPLTVTLQAPADGITQTNHTVLFIYNVSSYAGNDINNCSLWTDEDSDGIYDLNQTDLTITSTINQTFIQLFGNPHWLNWKVSCYSNDTIQGNSTARSLLINNKSTISPIYIYSNDIFNRTIADLTGTFNYVDSDLDSITANETRWYNNSIEESGLRNLTLILNGNTTTGEGWILSARVYDGYEWSSWYNSSNFSIMANNAPTIPTYIVPINGTVVNGTTMNITCGGSTDADGDTIYYQFFGDATFIPTTLIQNSTNMSHIWTITDPGTYYWRCRATDLFELSGNTSTRTFYDIFGGMNVSSINCGVGLTQAMHFDFVDESNHTAMNSSLDYNIDYGMSGLGSKKIFGSLENIDKLLVCINSSISNNYTINYGELQYVQTGWIPRRYYMFQNQRFTDESINDTLFLLTSGTATSFLFEFESTSLTPYGNKYSSLLRWYPDLDLYDVVEMGKTDEKGQTIMHVITEDVDYRVALYNTDGTLIKLLNPVRFACLSSPCSYSSIIEETPLDYTSIYRIEDNIAYSSGIFTYIYNDPSQVTDEMNMTVYRDSGTSSLLICSDTTVGYTGVLSCNVSAYTGILRAQVERKASPGIIIAQKIIQTASTVFKGSAGLFVSLIIFLILVMISLVSPILTIIFAIIGMIPAVILGSVPLEVFIALGVAGGLALHFMKRINQ